MDTGKVQVRSFLMDIIVFVGIGAISFYVMSQAAQFFGVSSPMVYVVHGYLWCKAYNWVKG